MWSYYKDVVQEFEARANAQHNAQCNSNLADTSWCSNVFHTGHTSFMPTSAPSKENIVVDALSWLPDELKKPAPCAVWSAGVNVTFSIVTDHSILSVIKAGNKTDTFCEHLVKMNTTGRISVNGLGHFGNHLLIPRIWDICKNLFHLFHDALGLLRPINHVWWLSHTKVASTLNPLPVPDGSGQLIAIDFVEPLKVWLHSIYNRLARCRYAVGNKTLTIFWPFEKTFLLLMK